MFETLVHWSFNWSHVFPYLVCLLWEEMLLILVWVMIWNEISCSTGLHIGIKASLELLFLLPNAGITGSQALVLQAYTTIPAPRLKRWLSSYNHMNHLENLGLDHLYTQGESGLTGAYSPTAVQALQTGLPGLAGCHQRQSEIQTQRDSISKEWEW